MSEALFFLSFSGAYAVISSGAGAGVGAGVGATAATPIGWIALAIVAVAVVATVATSCTLHFTGTATFDEQWHWAKSKIPGTEDEHSNKESHADHHSIEDSDANDTLHSSDDSTLCHYDATNEMFMSA